MNFLEKAQNYSAKQLHPVKCNLSDRKGWGEFAELRVIDLRNELIVFRQLFGRAPACHRGAASS